MPMIRECIVTTLSEEGLVHIAPLGLIATTLGDKPLDGEGEAEGWIVAPFRPSITLDNLRTTPFAVASFTDDVLVFAGCLTGNKDWPTRPATHVPGVVLGGALAHAELKVERVEEDEQRPRFHCRVDPRHPPAHAAAREGRARARLSPDRRGEDRRPPRARGVAALDREDRGPLQARVALSRAKPSVTNPPYTSRSARNAR
jgi:hypothetical protein